MREILFRGKRIDNGAWIEGDLLQNIDAIKIRELEKEKREIVKSYEVYPETVGEYTGLTDKHGRKIFEGDIIKYTKDGCIYEVVFAIEDGIAKFCARDTTDGKSLYYINTAKDKIIGNIHDNPELLE